jgi:hypothetical protein
MMCDNSSQPILDSSIDTTIVQNMTNLKLSPTHEKDYEDLGEGTSFGSLGKKFLKDSIERFDDHLVEFILQYLPLSDKVMFESVSNQWKKVIYNKQTEFELNRSETEDMNTLNKLLKPVVIKDWATGYADVAGFKAIDKHSLESILKKFIYIKNIAIDCYIDGEDLEIFGKFCPYLESIKCDAIGFNEQNLVNFGLKYGHRLKKIYFYNSLYGSAFIKKFMKFCLNLTEIHCEDNTTFISEDKLFLPELQIINSLSLREDNFNDLKILCEKYHNKLRKIQVYSFRLESIQPSYLMSNIIRFQNLEKLELQIDFTLETEERIDDYIKRLAENCAQLKDLDLRIYNENLVTDQIFYAFEKFSSLVKLVLLIDDNEKKFEGSVECFRFCSNLKLFDIAYKKLNENFFKDIHLFLPELRSIRIHCESELTDEIIFSLSKLKNLKKFDLRKSLSSNKLITDESVCELINSCENIELISFTARPKITNKTIQTLIDLALKKSRKNIQFFCGFSAAGDEAEFAQIDLNSFVNIMPENLRIIINEGDINQND